MADRGSVLVVYTGGTLGMLPKDAKDPNSPLAPASWKKLSAYVPALADMPIGIDVHEMMPIDSSDMTPAYWLEIAALIGKRYYDYDGFVILHGTDTMAYTTSAMSFLLENLSKPIVFTGAQKPIAQANSDAVSNLTTAIRVAGAKVLGLPLVPEVCVFFGGRLLRGNRARKVSSGKHVAFDSPNYPALGEAGNDITINKNVVRPNAPEVFRVSSTIDTNVHLLDLYPGMRMDILRAQLGADGLRGVVMRTFGSGNAPTTPEFLETLRWAIQDKGLVIVNITQCVEGFVKMGKYDASAEMLKLGVVGGADMTAEAALAKLQFLLGAGHDVETVRKLMQQDLRGELTATAEI